MSLDEYKPDHFSHEVHDDVVVVQVAPEKLSEEQNLEEFGVQLFAYVDQYECGKLALDCASVKYASSSAIGKLITLHRKLKRTEGRLVICCLQDAFREILQAARLYTYFETTETTEAAVELLKQEESSS